MDLSEVARLILYLRDKGLADKEIGDLILYIATGEEQYKPRRKED